MAYTPTIWDTDDLITKEKMNKLENGLAEVSQTAGGGTAGVQSFNGRAGTVTPANGDYTAAMVGARASDWLPSPEEIDAVSSTTVSTIASMTQAEYDALTEKVATVLYIIKG